MIVLCEHDSPLRSERHVNKKIASAVVRMKNGSTEVVEIGDMEVKKEFNFAGNIVKAAWTLINQDVIYEAVIGSGTAYSIRQWIHECCLIAEIPEAASQFIAKSGFESEYNILISDPKKIFSLGWRPETDFASLAKLMIQYKI